MNVKTYQHINLEYMDLMADGDDTMKKVMLEMLITELPEEVEKMKTLLQCSDWKELRSVSHKMKSTLAFVGNPEMTDTNKKIETIANDESDLDQLPTLQDTLERLTNKVMVELKEEVARL